MVERYSPHIDSGMDYDSDGHWVTYDDYVELETEAGRLKANMAAAEDYVRKLENNVVIGETTIANLHNVIRERDGQIADLVMALGEFVRAYKWKRGPLSYISPASRAAAEKWLAKKEER